MELQTVIGITAGCLTGVSSVPQILKVWKERKATAISPLMFFVLLAGNLLWVYYGILKEDWPIITTNAFATLANVIMILLHFRFKNRTSMAKS